MKPYILHNYIQYNDIQHNDIQHNNKWNPTFCIMTLSIMVEHCYVEGLLYWLSLILSVTYSPLWWVSVCWMPLYWVSLRWMPLWWVSWRRPGLFSETKVVLYWASNFQPGVFGKYGLGLFLAKLQYLMAISPIFYEQLFCMKVFCAAFMCLQFGFVIFWRKDFGAKASGNLPNWNCYSINIFFLKSVDQIDQWPVL